MGAARHSADRYPSPMTTGGIFLIGGDGLIELAQQAYESEGLLQSLLAEYPKLLAGEQMDPVDARRWVLVREVGV